MSSSIPTKNIPTKALVVEKPGAPFVVRDIVLDEVRADEVLVEVKYTGLCHTDFVVQNGGIPGGEFPAVLGHEGAGIVRRIGTSVKDKTLKEGDTVLLSFHTCRKCSHCRRGEMGTCPGMTEINFNGVRLSDGSSPASLPDGRFLRGQFFGQSSFSGMAIVAEDSVVKCDVSADELSIFAPLGCGYLTGAGTVLNVIKPMESTSVAIFGLGGVGLTALMAAKAAGAKNIVAVDIVTSKLEMAKKLGATHVIDSSKRSDISSAIFELVKDGVDGAVDTTGSPWVIEESIKSLAHAGTMALIGVPKPDSSVAIDPLLFLIGCKKIVGVIEGACEPAKMIPGLIKLYRQGKFPIDKISKTYPVDRLDQAIQDLKVGEVVKPVLSWDGVPNSTILL